MAYTEQQNSIQASRASGSLKIHTLNFHLISIGCHQFSRCFHQINTFVTAFCRPNILILHYLTINYHLINQTFSTGSKIFIYHVCVQNSMFNFSFSRYSVCSATLLHFSNVLIKFLSLFIGYYQEKSGCFRFCEALCSEKQTFIGPSA